MADHVNIEQRELAHALEEVARLALEGLAGFDGASVSVVHVDAVSTVAATAPHILVDRQGPGTGSGTVPA
jgi:hypothetical protein